LAGYKPFAPYNACKLSAAWVAKLTNGSWENAG
jgi:hypothetical protein